jgi:hypothetical protein
MLIPFGILASAGGAAGSYELIATAFGTGSSGTISFSSIPNTYKHLQIRWVANCGTGGSELLRMKMNGDSASNYVAHHIEGNGSSVSSYWTGAADHILIAELVATSTADGNFSAGITDILDFASANKFKTTRTFYGKVPASGTKLVTIRSGLWRSTSATTTIELSSAYGGNFASTSRFSLYGIKG